MSNNNYVMKDTSRVQNLTLSQNGGCTVCSILGMLSGTSGHPYAYDHVLTEGNPSVLFN
ncbi:MAG: hypothetical protein KAH03_07225 [Cocleimonas sp.]|nr:hypothetical protein [Cocleimonas sp.]